MTNTSELFQILAARHRRRILVLLLDAECIEVEKAIHTRGESCGVTTESALLQRGTEDESSTTSRVRSELHHIHLPKLEHHDLIEWDRERGTVSRGPQYPAIREALEVLSSNACSFPPDLL